VQIFKCCHVASLVLHSDRFVLDNRNLQHVSCFFLWYINIMHGGVTLMRVCTHVSVCIKKPN
jgi:hypothetical protein